MDIEINTNVSNIDVEVEKAGPQGLSAYQVAVKNGFVGTEQEWLDSLVGEKGDTGNTGATGEPGRDGVIQYTPGDNITIENNVISAIVSAYEGEEVHTFECTNTNPFVFDGKKKGIYINEKYENNMFYYKWASSTSKVGLSNSYPFIIILPNDYTYVSGQQQKNIAIIYMYDASFTRLRLVNITKQSNDSMNQSGGNIVYFLNDTTQAIYGVKTFANIPRQNDTTAPTQDAEFTNKKYVDDSISNKIWIGTQAEYDAITTPSESTIYFIKES